MNKSVKDLFKEKYGITRPIKEVKGKFECIHNELTSLEGCPKIVGSHFDCRYNDLISLDGCPEIVNHNFYCGQQDHSEFSDYDVDIRCTVRRDIYV